MYFDLEATGFRSSGRPRVCEMSLIAVNASDPKDLQESIMHILSGSVNGNSVQIENIYPRVLNKLTLCVYPMATIVPVLSTITGLDNYNLNSQSKFEKNIGDLLNIFLEKAGSTLSSEICVLTHM